MKKLMYCILEVIGYHEVRDMLEVFMKLKNLRNQLSSQKIKGYLIPSKDEFLGEYTPKHLARLKWLTDLECSNGLAIITDKKALFLTDGRYFTAARAELSKDWEIGDISDGAYIKNWVKKNIGDLPVGFDPMVFNDKDYNCFKKLDLNLKILESNLVDLVWSRKDEVKTEVYFLEKAQAGQNIQNKITSVCESLSDDVDYVLFTNPEATGWLLNMRGNDLEFTPLVLSYLFLSKDGNFKLFLKNELSDAKQYFLDLIKRKKKIQFDENKTPYWFFAHGGKAINLKADPTELMKSIKNETELKGIRKAHEEDGKAVQKFLKWFKGNVGKVDEIEAAEKLLEFRKASKNFISNSFETISAYGSNGAIIHYKPTKKTSKLIKKDSLYLLDCGAQYQFGTTDITRTMCFGKPTKEQKTNYTLVLKGHIALAMAEFPEGTNGSQLDILARQFLWSYGLDYGHGTGHGVGHFLSVHEGPQRIGKMGANQPLLEGMIISNEPGFYKVGEYGIRIENLVEVVKSSKKGFLKFSTITQVPIDTNLVDKKLLTPAELKWLTEYNKRCKIK